MAAASLAQFVVPLSSGPYFGLAGAKARRISPSIQITNVGYKEQKRPLGPNDSEGLSRRDSAAWHRVQPQRGYPAYERRKAGR